jgi:MFS family permease
MPNASLQELSPARTSQDSLFSAFLPLLPLMLVVFIGFLVMGMALPVLPRHVHDTLGQGTVMVGVVMGSQFASSLIARIWAGEVADARGVRTTALAGLLVTCCVGAVYLLSLLFADRPPVALGILIAARLLTGVAESLAITAILSWGIARVGPAHAGKVIGWIGMALFAAYAAGAPAGVALHARFGFGGIAVATLVVPLLAFVVARFVAGVAPTTVPRLPFYKVIGAIKLPGVGLTLCAAGYAMIAAFIALLFAQRGWGSGALAFTSIGAGFIIARLLFGHLPDKLGGARVALFCVLAEAVGLLMIWGAPSAMVACAGAVLTGGGYALGFQGYGVEAVRRAPPESRGAAMGAYVAFQDIAMGLAGPLGGLLANAAGLDAVYLAAAIAAVGAAGVSLLLLRSGR